MYILLCIIKEKTMLAIIIVRHHWFKDVPSFRDGKLCENTHPRMDQILMYILKVLRIIFFTYQWRFMWKKAVIQMLSLQILIFGEECIKQIQARSQCLGKLHIPFCTELYTFHEMHIKKPSHAHRVIFQGSHFEENEGLYIWHLWPFLHLPDPPRGQARKRG